MLVTRSMKILGVGTSGLLTAYKKAQKLEQIRKKNGSTALSYSEFQFLKKATSDKWKIVRVLLTAPLSPELCFYSYIVFPVISAGNPWAWQALPCKIFFFSTLLQWTQDIHLIATFDDEEYIKARESIVKKRRVQAVLSSLVFLKSETIDDTPAKKREERIDQIEVLHNALNKKNSLSKALNELSTFFEEKDTPKQNKKEGGMNQNSSSKASTDRISHL